MSQLFGAVIQLGFVVPDLETALDHWIHVMGVGPFYRIDRMHPPGGDYRGEPTDIEISAAFSYCGEQQVELIEQHNDAPSVYRDFLIDHPAGGLHHLAFWTDGIEARLHSLAEAGHAVDVVQRYGTDHAYLRTDGQPGTMVQLMHATEMYVGLFEMIRAAVDDWDGSDPVRSLG